MRATYRLNYDPIGYPSLQGKLFWIITQICKVISTMNAVI